MGFESALAVTLKFEGGYANHPADPGGATMKGITQRVYDAWLLKKGLPACDVRDIPDKDVADIYRAEYWQRAKCDVLPDPLATFHFDAAVNHGPARANIFLGQSGGDPKKYLDIREKFFRDLVIKRSAMVVFLRGWLKRVDKLREMLA